MIFIIRDGFECETRQVEASDEAEAILQYIQYGLNNEIFTIGSLCEDLDIDLRNLEEIEKV